MNKLILSLIAASLIISSCKKSTSDPQEQPPPTPQFAKFKKLYGGSSYDYIGSAIPAIDGGYIINGLTQSDDGDIPSSFAFQDMWLFKINDTGKVVWSKTFGGTSDEFMAWGIVPAADGYIIAGATTSTDGNVTIVKDDFRQHLLIKVDKLGNTVWQKKFSQFQNAQIISIAKAKNGDIIGSGYVVPWGEPGRGWIFRLTSEGDLVWEKSYDVSIRDLTTIVEAADGDLIAMGTVVQSNNPDQVDALLLRTTSTGDSLWAKPLGGSIIDQGSGVVATTDGGALMTAITNSSDGLAIGNHGNNDVLVVKVDSDGNVEWNKLFGGTGDDYGGRAVIETSEHNYIFSASSYSQNGDLPGNKEIDAWILTLKSDGTVLKKTQFGGNLVDEIEALLPLSENKFFAAGFSTSTDGDFAKTRGGYEGWAFTFEH